MSIPALSASAPNIEFIFHGTGTSSSVPNISCITADPITCETCGSTLTPQGQKNKRRNTGGILRVLGNGQRTDKVIVIDVGKTFLSAAHDLFPRYGLRRIDAVILTHPHADAMNGLDDLRGWTLEGSVQDHIDLYVSAFTFKEVQRSFPYLVAKEFATGGGDIPEFKWHIIKENEPFRIEGLDFDITPIVVHHGRLFTNEGEVPGLYDTPGGSGAATPLQAHSNSNHGSGPLSSSQHGPIEPLEHSDASRSTVVNSAASNSSLAFGPTNTSSLLPSHVKLAPPKPRPYLCFGFIFGDFMVYISDVSHIPEDAWRTIESSPVAPGGSNESDKSAEVSLTSLSLELPTNRYKVLVVDCLKLEPHTSHFGIQDAAYTAKRVNAQRTYMVGFGHRILHSDWEIIGEYLGGRPLNDSEMARSHVSGASRILSQQKGASIWIRPAYDGLRLFANGTDVWEDSI